MHETRQKILANLFTPDQISLAFKVKGSDRLMSNYKDLTQLPKLYLVKSCNNRMRP